MVLSWSFNFPIKIPPLELFQVTSFEFDNDILNKRIRYGLDDRGIVEQFYQFFFFAGRALPYLLSLLDFLQSNCNVCCTSRAGLRLSQSTRLHRGPQRLVLLHVLCQTYFVYYKVLHRCLHFPFGATSKKGSQIYCFHWAQKCNKPALCTHIWPSFSYLGWYRIKAANLY